MKTQTKNKLTFLSRCLVSILLILALALLGMPQTVNALGESLHSEKQPSLSAAKTVEAEEYEPELDTNPLLSQTEEKEKYIEFEDINRRTETEKHYYMSDGTFMSETYAEPIHYEDANGKLKDIDNSLVEFTADGKQKVKNARNSFSAEFATTLTKDNPVFSLGKGEYRLDMFLDTEFEENQQNDPLLLDIALDKEGSVKTDSTTETKDTSLEKGTSVKKDLIAAQISNADKYVAKEVFNYKDKMLTKGLDNENLKSELKYKNAISGTDFQYILEQNAVKENIIVNQKKDKYEYRFIFEVEGLELYLWSGGNIQALNEAGDIIYEIPAPYMFDANEEYSNAVKYVLEKLDEYKYELRVVADEKWINSEERAFPVIIDPTVTVPYNTSQYQITRVTNKDATGTGTSNWYVRHNLFGSTISRLVVKFNSTLTDKTVIARALDFEIKKNENGGKDVLGYLYSNTNLSTAVTWSSTSFSGNPIFQHEASTSWVGKSLAFDTANFGVMFKFTTENTALIHEVGFQNFKVREYYLASNKANINYDNEMFNLTFDIIDSKARLTIPYYVQEALLMPISVYGIYVQGFSSLKQNYVSGAQDFYGKDWKLNIEQYMIKTRVTDDIIFYTYIDESGDDTPFIYDSTSGYYVSGELEYKDGWLGRKGNRKIYHFDGNGRLDKIQNPDGQYITIEYDSAGKIISIANYIHKNSSGAYQQLTRAELIYSSNLLRFLDIYMPDDSTNWISTLSYDSTNKLTQATVEGRNVNISYSGSNILSVADHNGIGYYLDYSNTSYTYIKQYSRVSGTTYDYVQFSKIGTGAGTELFVNSYYYKDSVGISTTQYRFNKEYKLTEEVLFNLTTDGGTSWACTTTYQTTEKESGGVKTRTDITTVNDYIYGNDQTTTVVTTLNGSNKNAKTITTQTDEETTTTKYNTYGQLTQQITSDNGVSYTVNYTYKTSGDTSTKNHLVYQISDSKGITQVYEYQNDTTSAGSVRGLATKITTKYSSSQSDWRYENFAYDTYGNVYLYTDQLENLYMYTYEFRGNSNLVKVFELKNLTEGVLYSYNSYGRLVSMTNDGGVTTAVQLGTRTNRYSLSSGLYYDYNYLYNGDLSLIKRLGTTMINYSYESNGDLNSKTFANGQKMSYSYYVNGNLKTKTASGESNSGGFANDEFNYNYYSFQDHPLNSSLYYMTDKLKTVSAYGYLKTYTHPQNTRQGYMPSDPKGTINVNMGSWGNFTSESTFSNETELLKNTKYTIDGISRTHYMTYKNTLTGQIQSESEGAFTSSYGYRNNNSVTSYTKSSGSTNIVRSHNYDANNVTGGGKDWLHYITDVTSYNFGSRTYRTNLTYDISGNIKSMTRTNNSSGTGTVLNKDEYTYDASGRLKTEKNTVYGNDYLYEYDSYNNLKYVTYNTNGNTYKQTYNYSYDRLTSISDTNPSVATQYFAVDALGNHLQYGGYNLKWTRGRMLEQVTRPNNSVPVNYRYDENGMLLQKRIGNGSEMTYFWDGDRLIAEKQGNYLVQYYYDQTGVAGIIQGGVSYMFVKDALGSIIEIVDPNGTVVAKYEYDAWGKIIYQYNGSIIATNNSFGYRGYFMDRDTGFYYLQTRWYDPVVRRFLNADDYELIPQLADYIGGLNLYAYCNNNPVMLSDSSGCSPFWDKVWAGVVGFLSVAAIVGGAILTATGIGAPIGAMLIGAGIGGLVGMGGSVISQGLSNGWGNINWGQVAFNGAIGMATGALMASPLGAVATGFAVGGLGFAQSVGNDLYGSGGDWGQVNWGRAAVLGVVSGLIAGGGKYLTNSSTLMNKFVNGSSSVKSLGAQSLQLGLAGRGTYTAYWMNVMIMQTIYRTGTSVGMNLLRGGARTLINLLW